MQVCPDGSAVGRTGPNCEFAPCPQGGSGGNVGGNARNLALLGIKSSDVLWLNYYREYAGGTYIGGPVEVDQRNSGSSNYAGLFYILIIPSLVLFCKPTFYFTGI